MTPDRSLSPSDASVALRSFPRRFRAAFAGTVDDERFDPDEIGRRPGPDGRSAVDHLVAAEELLGLLAGALQALGGGDASVDPALADVEAVRGADPGGPVGDLLDRFETAATSADVRVGAMDNDDWANAATSGDGSVDALAVTQDVVGAVAEHLRGASRAIEHVT